LAVPGYSRFGVCWIAIADACAKISPESDLKAFLFSATIAMDGDRYPGRLRRLTHGPRCGACSQWPYQFTVVFDAKMNAFGCHHREFHARFYGLALSRFRDHV
jgi:hypothetical protein